MKEWFEIFKTGNHTDSSGKNRNWTEEDLDKIVANYKPEDHEAPIVVGHPKHNSPAYGWIEALKREGNKLFAKPKQLVDEFVDAVKQGRYKKRSISLYPDLTLRHVGFLGGMPPAVKGLDDVEFSEEQDPQTFEFEEYELSAWYFRNIGTLLRRIKNYLIEKEGAETAEDILPEYDLGSAAEAPRIFKKEENNFKEKINEEEMTEEKFEQQLNEYKEKIDSLTGDLASTKEELQTEKDKNAQLVTGQRMKELRAFADSDEVKNKIKPAEKESVVQLMALADSSGELEFSENGETKKVSALDALKGLLKNQPDVVDMGETATKDKVDTKEVDVSEFADKNVDEERLEVHKRALKISREENISYQEAVDKALSI